jgi:hypothetical protein
MSKVFVSLLGAAARLWIRFNSFLVEQNSRQLAAWGSALQYKRRYTNPDAAKRARSPL